MNTEKNDENDSRLSKMLRMGIMDNAVVWECSIIALIIVMQNSSSEKGLFPILGGGLAVGLMLVSILQKQRNIKNS